MQVEMDSNQSLFYRNEQSPSMILFIDKINQLIEKKENVLKEIEILEKEDQMSWLINCDWQIMQKYMGLEGMTRKSFVEFVRPILERTRVTKDNSVVRCLNQLRNYVLRIRKINLQDFNQKISLFKPLCPVELTSDHIEYLRTEQKLLHNHRLMMNRYLESAVVSIGETYNHEVSDKILKKRASRFRSIEKYRLALDKINNRLGFIETKIKELDNMTISTERPIATTSTQEPESMFDTPMIDTTCVWFIRELRRTIEIDETVDNWKTKLRKMSSETYTIRDVKFKIMCNWIESNLVELIIWAINNPILIEIDVLDLIKLIENSWSQVFLIDYLYLSIFHDLSDESLSLKNSNDNFNLTLLTLLGDEEAISELYLLENLLKKLEFNQIDHLCLRYLILMNPDMPSLHDTKKVQKIQEHIYQAYRLYPQISSGHDQTAKFDEMIKLMNKIKSLTKEGLQNLNKLHQEEINQKKTFLRQALYQTNPNKFNVTEDKKLSEIVNNLVSYLELFERHFETVDLMDNDDSEEVSNDDSLNDFDMNDTNDTSFDDLCISNTDKDTDVDPVDQLIDSNLQDSNNGEMKAESMNNSLNSDLSYDVISPKVLIQ